jgi:hypothetical protein
MKLPCLFAGVLRSSWTALTNYAKRMYEGETSHEIVDAHRAVFGSASKLVLLDERASLHPSIWQYAKVKAETTATSQSGSNNNSNKIRPAMAHADDTVLPILET